MSARITIQSGIAAGTSHRVNGRVARVGSDPQSDICLPTADVPAHALTLEFRDEGCRIYNRCRSSVYVGSQTVEPDEVAAWPETDILQLGDDIELLLDFSEDSFDTFAADYDDAPDHHVETSTASSPQLPNQSTMAKTVLQLVVTVVCLVGCVLLLVRDKNRKQPSALGPSFADVITESLESNDVPRELVQRIQHAEALRIRGRESEATTEYQRIRDDLLHTDGTKGRQRTTAQGSIMHLIQKRLEDGA